ncbi:MAG: TIM barrel protein [Alkalispirochaeta sp.]
MIRVANAPCSWGVIENVEGSRLTYENVLDEIAETGYAGTELGDWGFMPTDPGALAAALEKRGLALVGSWVSVYLHDPSRLEQSISEAVRTARLLRAVGGEEAVIVLGNDPHTDIIRTNNAGRITPDMGLTPAQFRKFTDGANAVARAIRDETGLRTVFHPHIATFVETPDEIRQFVDGTDPDLVGIAFDTAHIAYGGGDPVEALRRYGDRVRHVHFKGYSEAAAAKCRAEKIDGVAAVGEGVFCELAGSDIDFPAILSVLREIGYDGWIVNEQDVLPGTGTPKENARRNREFMRSIGI